MKTIEIETWDRKELFFNFLDYEDPFFNICADVSVKTLKQYVLDHNESYFIASFYLALRFFNEMEAFKMKMDEG